MNLVINPLKSICLKYKNKDVGINELNDTCYGICASFNKTNDLYEIDPNCSKICDELVNSKKHDYEKQTPYKPIIWEQIPTYIPDLLKKGIDKNQVLIECKKLCKNNLECKEKCELDFNAIENYTENYTEMKNKSLNDNKNLKSSSNQKIYYLLFLIPIIIFLMIKKN